jgi:hypothetical protein
MKRLGLLLALFMTTPLFAQTVSVTCAPNPATVVTPFVCTANLSAGGAAVNGTVIFMLGAAGPCGPVSQVVNNTATSCPITWQFAGSPLVTATFHGTDGSVAVSPPYSEVINPTTQNVTFTNNPIGTPAPSLVGQMVTFVVPIVQLPPIVVPGPVTGTVVFTSDGVVIGTVGVVNNQATTQTAALPVGLHTIVASYHGDANNLPSISGVWIQEVDDPPPPPKHKPRKH